MDLIQFPMPLVEKETVNGTQSSFLYTEAFNRRKIFLFGSIDENTSYAFTNQTLHLMQDKTQPIDIYINSPGGNVLDGLAIYDIIQGCEAPVNLYCISLAASMASIIFAGGEKGRRFILPNSKIMIHEPLINSTPGGSASSIATTAESLLKTRELLNGILAKHTGKSIKEINAATKEDRWFTADEALKFGLADAIVTKIDEGKEE